MTAAEIKSFFAEKIKDSQKEYIQDLEAMSEEDLARSTGGCARNAHDFTFETAFVNRRVAKRLRGETPEPVVQDGWIMAPEGRNKASSAEDIRSSIDEVLAAWEALPEADLSKEIVLPDGRRTSPVDLAFLVAFHTGYHDAQLNYIQTLSGDSEVHWK